MAKLLFISIKTSFILIICLASLNATSACLKSSRLYSIKCPENSKAINDLNIEPTFISYRLATRGSNIRKCRFSPTCSRFMIESVQRHGFIKGMRNGFARAQMQHDNHWGVLPIDMVSEFLVVRDPIQNWDD